jgi:glutamyl-tRNA synthetase
MIKNLDKKIRAYALKNALAYNGKAMQGPVISALFNEGLKRNEVGKYSKEIIEILSEVNKLSLDEQKKEFEKLEKEVSEREVREGLQELPNAGKGVVMRFAPSASGPLHAMHAVVAGYSFLYAKKYGGKFYIRIEDTNPDNIYPKAYKMIKEESDWLFNKTAKIIVQSERMELYYEYARKLIAKKTVYVCTCAQEEFRKFSDNMENCPCRNLTARENLERWKKMLDKKGFSEGEAVLRFKSGMKHKNPAMRDFPLARINETKHPLQKVKYRVWPLMNLAVAVDDIDLGMTHIIRGKDHRDNAERQKLIFKALGKKFPWTFFLGRLHFKDMEFSTSAFRKGIEAGEYSGWDDKRLPTVASLKKQGYKPEAFLKFAERSGLSENDKVIGRNEFFQLLDEFNKQ